MQSIPLPQNPKLSLTGENTGRFEIEDCYPGYGTTLGNAIRRVLLSSMPGSAITAVKIKNVKHEFSTIPNVLEDVIQIILNLKKVRFRLYKDGPVQVTLKAKGEKNVTAGMIECPGDVEVINKDAHIATLTSAKGEIEIEIEIGNGIGYVPVEQQEREKKEVGVIAIDAIYTPVRRVNYTIENMRVGKRTDFERINLDISTDGSVTPEEAYQLAVNILVEQFSAIKELGQAVKEEKKEEAAAPEKKEEKTVSQEDPTKITIDNLKNLSTRTVNVLEKNGVKTIGDILKHTEEQIGGLEGMGAKGIKEIKKAIGDFGVNLKK